MTAASTRPVTSAEAKAPAGGPNAPLQRINAPRGFWGGFGQTVREIWQYRELLGNLIRKELKVKYKDSVLGFVWSLLMPLVQLARVLAGHRQVSRRRLPSRLTASTSSAAWSPGRSSPRSLCDRHHLDRVQRRPGEEGLLSRASCSRWPPSAPRWSTSLPAGHPAGRRRDRRRQYRHSGPGSASCRCRSSGCWCWSFSRPRSGLLLAAANVYLRDIAAPDRAWC